MGETGVGKSTWINGFANYSSYSTLEEAEAKEPINVIPASFTVLDGNFQDRLIRTGFDQNEKFEEGKSATQYPKDYVFETGGITVRLIDTPGIGDTNGVEQDKENFKNIMKHIETINALHGICILLKPNNARINVMFRYCINELLTNLHVDACRNIIFCYTNSRGTFYNPGETLPSLKRLLKEDGVPIEINKDITYCIDNEAIRFLAASRRDVTFTNAQHEDISESWKKSVLEIERLMKRLATIAPHLVKNTLSINESRRLISVLMKPLTEISATVQENISSIETAKVKLERLSEEMKTKISIGKFSIPFLIIEPKALKLDKPLKVCMSEMCLSRVSDGNVTKHLYNCQKQKQKETTKRSIAPIKSSKCKRCGCHKSEHKIINYEILKMKNSQRIDITDRKEAASIYEAYMRQLKDRLREYVNEQQKITRASAKCACFLKKYAITPYNDALDEYLIHVIKVERSNGGDEKTLLGLEAMREDYKKQCTLLDESIRKTRGDRKLLTPSDIQMMRKDLYQMKHMGKALREAVQVAEDADEEDWISREVRVNTLRRDQAASMKNRLQRLLQDTKKHVNAQLDPDPSAANFLHSGDV